MLQGNSTSLLVVCNNNKILQILRSFFCNFFQNPHVLRSECGGLLSKTPYNCTFDPYWFRYVISPTDLLKFKRSINNIWPLSVSGLYRALGSGVLLPLYQLWIERWKIRRRREAGTSVTYPQLGFEYEANMLAICNQFTSVRKPFWAEIIFIKRGGAGLFQKYYARKRMSFKNLLIHVTLCVSIFNPTINESQMYDSLSPQQFFFKT